MSTSRAAIGTTYPDGRLQHFADVTVAKVELRGEVGQSWVLIASVQIRNLDGSVQVVEARLVRDANVDIEVVREDLTLGDTTGITLLAGLVSDRDIQTITLVCNTFFGWFTRGRIVALSVDDIDFQ